MVIDKFESRTQHLTFQNKQWTNRKERLEGDLKLVQRRYAVGEIDRAIYDGVRSEINSELGVIDSEIEKSRIELSNFHSRLNDGLQLLKNLSVMWDRSSLEAKERLQKALFPTGVVLNEKNEYYRTDGLNTFVAAIVEISNSYDTKEKRNDQDLIDHSSLVARTRIELVSKV